jgi:hypothetical protein
MTDEILDDYNLPQAPLGLDSNLGALSKHAQDVLKLEEEILALEEQLGGLKLKLKDIIEKTIPEEMLGLGLIDFTLESGEKITVEQFYTGSITEQNADQAFAFLSNNGYEDLIKREVKVSFAMSEYEKSEEFLKTVSDSHLSFNDKLYVHPSTLKAFIKESYEKNLPVPYELFNVYVGQRAKIKRPK